jgi:hypothetical protein
MRPIPSELHVVTCVVNPQRYKSRYKLYKEFEKRVLDAGARLTTVEAAFGDRPLELKDTDRINHISLTTKTELWHKEAMLNIGISQLPPDWKYMAWIDSDVLFARPDWVQETLQQLQHYSVVQMFSQARDLTPNYSQFHDHKGFVWSWRTGQNPGQSYNMWHPGFAWAARRDAIDHIGRLFDYAILGAADRHMACSMIGRIEDSFPDGLKTECPEYYEKLLVYQERALKHINKNIGYVDGLLLHYWHGKKADRRYMDRWKILMNCKYDPELDLKRDWQGLWQIADHAVDLRDQIRDYFRQRNEDSIDVG